MTFYRSLTRQRTLNSILEFDTTDNGLKHSVSNFTKSPRVARFFNCFEIREDYCTKIEKYARGSINPPYVERSESIKIPRPLVLHDTQKRTYHKETCVVLKKHQKLKGNCCSFEKLNGEEKSYSRENHKSSCEQPVDSENKSTYMDMYKGQDSNNYMSQYSLDLAMKSSLRKEEMMTKTGREEILQTLKEKDKPEVLDAESKFEVGHSSKENDEVYKTSYSEQCYKHETLSSYNEDLEGSFFSD